MNKENRREYIKNTLILFAGKFSTQLISILLLPVFTYYIDTSDYGTVDLIQTYINLFVPVIILCLENGIFRFLIDYRQDEKKQKEIITSSLIFTVFQSLVLIILFLIITWQFNFKYSILTLCNIIVLMFTNEFMQVCRGLGKNKDYSIATVLNAVCNLTLNLVLIIAYGFGGASILISSIVSNFIGILYIFIKCELYKNVKVKYIRKNTLKNMLNYSIPLIPNTLSWWVINVSDRTIISYFLSTAANGIYTISCKFSNIINSIFSIFIMSWQETASIHINDYNKDEFFSDMIQQLLNFFSSLIIILIAFLPLIFNVVIGSDYSDSYNYIPILLVSCIFSIFTSLLGGIYIAKKETKKVAKTSFLSAIINLIINVLCINRIGLYAACCSTLISYFIMSVYRFFDIKKYISLKLNWKIICLTFMIFVITCLIYYLNIKLLSLLTCILSIILFFAYNKEFLNDFLNLIKIKNSKDIEK